MVYTGVLTALLLFSLFSSEVSAEEVDLNTLPKIINFFENHYKPSEKTDSGDGAQYAVVINVPADQCKANSNLSNFLSEEKPEVVRRDLGDRNKRLYEGKQMVAARPKGTVHSERALLMCGVRNEDVAPVQDLLNKDKDGCVVFYTYNSPCLDNCLNRQKESVKKCILDSLSVLTHHRGPKAFVFNRVYRMDEQKTQLLTSALKEVAQKVPLYKCSTNSCIKCLNGDQINNQCVS